MPEVVNIRGMDHAVIHVQLRHAQQIARWASVGRTIGWAIEQCADPDLVEELCDLKASLDDFGNACKLWSRGE